MSSGQLRRQEMENIVGEIREYAYYKKMLVDGGYSPEAEAYFDGNISTVYDFIKVVDAIKSKCKTCWADFIGLLSFTRYAVKMAESSSRYIIYPNPDGRNFFRYTPKDGFYVEYDFRSKIFALTNRNLLMLDFDYKEEGNNLAEIKIMLYDVVEIAKDLGVDLSFVVFPSDRGVHVFCLSHKIWKNLLFSEFMIKLCNDANYTSFCYARGTSMRLSPKPDHPDDIVSWHQPEILTEKDSPDDYFKTIPFRSELLGKTIDIKTFSVEDLDVIGQGFDKDAFRYIKQQYHLIRYFTSLSKDVRDMIHCEIFDSYIFQNDKTIAKLRVDVERILRL